MNNNRNIREIHKDIKRVIEVKSLVVFFSILAKNLKKDKKQQLREYNMYVPLFAKNPKKMNDVYKITNSLIYQASQKVEKEEKKQLINKTITYNRSMQRVFYIASSHEDCAEDHKEYQGKIYVDEKYKSLLGEDSRKSEVEEFIKRNKIKTFQWVIDKPVWFITRPNCRHYFKSLPTDEVLEKDTKTLTRNHKMHTQQGREKTRTINHPINKSWYTKENVESIIEKYKERLEYHRVVYKTFKSPTIKRAIEKDELLIDKWLGFLNKM